ncbi:MAG: hypothetical protein U1F83_03955 [Verrucomicrobiota bacterium]
MSPAISPDGRLIAFAAQGLRIADRIAQTEWLAASNSGSAFRFSGDGNWLTYTRYASGVQANPMVSGSNQVYLYDIQNRIETLVSHAMSSTVFAAGHSELPDISPDGRFVVYRTLATNLVNSVNGTSRQIILYDRLTGQNSLVSASYITGLQADDNSLRASFSTDGQLLLLQSWASDLLANDFNRNGDVFSQPIFMVRILPPGTAGEGPWLYWPFAPGNNYAVQFKSGLDNPMWQTLPGSITNDGVKAWTQDVSPTNSQRIYRVRSF